MTSSQILLSCWLNSIFEFHVLLLFQINCENHSTNSEASNDKEQNLKVQHFNKESFLTETKDKEPDRGEKRNQGRKE